MQRKFSLERTNFDSYMDAINRLTSLVKDREKYMKKYEENLAMWSRLPEEDLTITNYFSELEILVPDEDE